MYERAKKLDACMMMQFPALQLPDSGLVGNMEEYVQHMLTPTGPAPPAPTPAPVRAPAAAAPPAPRASAADPFMQVCVPPVERRLGLCPPLWGRCLRPHSDCVSPVFVRCLYLIIYLNRQDETKPNSKCRRSKRRTSHLAGVRFSASFWASLWLAKALGSLARVKRESGRTRCWSSQTDGG